MKNLLTALLLYAASSFAQTEDLKTMTPSSFKTKPWYNDMLRQLKSNDKIDSIDAYQIKMLSSDGRVARSTCASIINTRGKLTESDLHAIAYNKKNDTLYYIISRSGVYSHLFVYDRIRRKLNRVYNTRAAIVTEGYKMVLNAMAPKLVIFAVKKPDDPEDRHQFYLYHEQKGTFTHFKNCRRVNGKVECDNVKL